MPAKRIIHEVPEFWMICRDDRTSEFPSKWASSPNPKKLYTSEASARHDAEELCKQSNKPFFLLRVVGVVRTTTPPVEWIE